MTINIFMYIYIGENGHWDIYAPPPLQIITHIFFQIFLIFFFHFRCILLQISHKKCFFISISILGRSGVKRLQLLKIVDIFKLRVLKFYYNLYNGLLPAYFNVFLDFITREPPRVCYVCN